MNILLIDPPFYRFIGFYNRFFPLGLTYLGTVLRNEGHTVLIYDADCNTDPSKMDYSRLEESYPLYLKSLKTNNHLIWKEIRENLEKFNPDVVGITLWTTFAASAFSIASLCKKYDKNMPVIMGGPHASIQYNEVMDICPDVDFLVRGEGENTFKNLIEVLDVRRGTYNVSYKNVKGISYRQNGRIIHNPPAEFIHDLDAIPFPDRDLLLNKSSYNAEDMGLLMTSRGCPYDCSYCATSIWQRKTRYRSVDNVIEEIQLIQEHYGTKQFTLKDDSFTVNKKRVKDFCHRLMKEKININWECNARADSIDEELLKTMKKAGCNSLKIGIESGSERVLQLMNKKITIDQCRNAARLLRKAGIHWTAYFMIGLPSETKEDMYRTLKFMKDLRPDYASLSVYEPFPGTSLFNIGIEKGLVENNRSMEDFYSLSPKYYYVKDVDHRVDTMSKEEFDDVEMDIKEEFHKYNRGLLRLLKRAFSRSGLYLHEPKMLWTDFKKFRSWSYFMR